MGKRNREMTSIRLAFSMGNFFFWVVVDGVLTSPLTPLFPFTPLDAFLHLDVNSVTVEVGKKDSVPPMGFWKVCQWWKILKKFSSGARKLQVVQIFGRISNLKWTQAKNWELFCVSTGILSYFSPSMVPIKDGTRARELLHKKVPFIITGVMDHIS